MSKLPPTAPGQLTVIFFPLVALHHSSCCKLPTGGSSGYCLHRSGNHPQLQRVHDGGNQSINCNGTGATAIAMAMGQRRWRSIDRLQLGNGTGALGNWGNCNSNGNGATARRNGATATAIDRLQWGNGNGATGAIAMAMGHRSRGNRTVIATEQ
jgi:hypothetical protein